MQSTPSHIILFLTLAITACSCSRSPDLPNAKRTVPETTVEDAPEPPAYLTLSTGDLVDAVGSHPISGKGDVVRVMVEPDATVTYELVNSDGKVLLSDRSGASKFQRWFLMLDKSDRLWFWSSDIGGCFWYLDQGKYVQSAIQPTDLAKMPKPFRAAMPGSAKRYLERNL